MPLIICLPKLVKYNPNQNVTQLQIWYKDIFVINLFHWKGTYMTQNILQMAFKILKIWWMESFTNYLVQEIFEIRQNYIFPKHFDIEFRILKIKGPYFLWNIFILPNLKLFGAWSDILFILLSEIQYIQIKDSPTMQAIAQWQAIMFFTHRHYRQSLKTLFLQRHLWDVQLWTNVRNGDQLVPS